MEFDVKKCLDTISYDFLKIISFYAKKENTNLYLVGGVVRDIILKNKVKDIDLILDKNAIEFCLKLPSEIKVKSIHKDFSTAKVEYIGKIFDIATTRKERYATSGALPDVIETEVKIEDDVKRRDFTINSLYLRVDLIDNDLKFELVDLVNGIDDINNKTLKVLHKKSYIDDPTRILRGLGFKYRFGFDFFDYDKKLIADTINSLNLEKASIDRLKCVFLKILTNEKSLEIFKEAVENKYYKLLLIDEANVDFQHVQEITETFKLTYLEIANFYFDILYNPEIEKLNFKNKLEIYKTFSKYKKVHLAYYLYKTNDENVVLFNNIRDIKLLISGDDLLKIGFKQGKIFKEIFDSLLLYKIENNLKNYTLDDEINWVKNNFK